MLEKFKKKKENEEQNKQKSKYLIPIKDSGLTLRDILILVGVIIVFTWLTNNFWVVLLLVAFLVALKLCVLDKVKTPLDKYMDKDMNISFEDTEVDTETDDENNTTDFF